MKHFRKNSGHRVYKLPLWKQASIASSIGRNAVKPSVVRRSIEVRLRHLDELAPDHLVRFEVGHRQRSRFAHRDFVRVLEKLYLRENAVGEALEEETPRVRA